MCIYTVPFVAVPYAVLRDASSSLFLDDILISERAYLYFIYNMIVVVVGFLMIYRYQKGQTYTSYVIYGVVA